MNTPNTYTAEQIKHWDIQTETGGRWIPARPLGYQGLFLWHRLKAAWLVFTGKCDVLSWEPLTGWRRWEDDSPEGFHWTAPGDTGKGPGKSYPAPQLHP